MGYRHIFSFNFIHRKISLSQYFRPVILTFLLFSVITFFAGMALADTQVFSDDFATEKSVLENSSTRLNTSARTFRAIPAEVFAAKYPTMIVQVTERNVNNNIMPPAFKI